VICLIGHGGISFTALSVSLRYTDAMASLGRFQRHLLHFAAPNSTKITLLSSLRASLALGLDFPVALTLSIGLRLLYAPFPYLSPVDIPSVPQSYWRTQLEDVKLTADTYTRADLLHLYQSSLKYNRSDPLSRSIDTMHVMSFWAMTADVSTGLVKRADVERFQEGDWERDVVKRRRTRRQGEGDVLPLWRGGPISVAGHSWFVRKLFGVRVYEP
jgi:hypothetical protein